MTDDRIFAGVVTGFGVLLMGLLYIGISFDSECMEKNRPAMEARAKMWLEAEAQAIKNCLAKGGYPVQSSWDGRFKDCR